MTDIFLEDHMKSLKELLEVKKPLVYIENNYSLSVTI